MKKLLTRSLWLAALAFVMYLASIVVKEYHYRANMPMGEVVGPNENAVMAQAIAMALKMINHTRGKLMDEGVLGTEVQPDSLPQKTEPVIYRRDVHIKSHGCVTATLTIPELAETYRWGVFSEPATFDAIVRFSNGDYVIHPDKTRDARGMAIKLLNVPGEKLLPQYEQASTQDFVMMNSPNYFIRFLEDYVELTKYLGDGDNFGYFLNGWSWNPFSWRWRELRLVLGSKKPPPESPLLAQYYSASAYKLGPENNIKFSAKPAQCADDAGQAAFSTPGSWNASKGNYKFLRERMKQQLGSGPACFDFMVQLQVPGKQMPVEDATIVWDEKDSPFVTVAKLSIPPQQFDTDANNEFCENLSFNPWHTVEDHRPIGVFNRIRKALYNEVSKYRRAANERLRRDETSITLEPGQPAEP